MLSQRYGPAVTSGNAMGCGLHSRLAEVDSGMSVDSITLSDRELSGRTLAEPPIGAPSGVWERWP